MLHCRLNILLMGNHFLNLPEYSNTDDSGKGIEELKLVTDRLGNQLFSPQSVNTIGFFVGNDNTFCWGKIYGAIPGKLYTIKYLLQTLTCLV